MSGATGQLLDRLGRLGRPHYVYNPVQIPRRLAAQLTPARPEARTRLPWGGTITYDPREAVGSGIQRCGVFDLLVCETLLRLADPGETALDVGANIGQMSSALAHAVGPSGRVLSFEPHPLVFERLAVNAGTWSGSGSAPAPIELHRLALSDRKGTATLSGRFFATNHGSATLEQAGSASATPDGHEVPVARLDDVLGPDVRVGVMKIDIEGHELQALRGAEALLGSERVRDVLFEERGTAPTPVTDLLAEHGFTVLRLEERLRGPRLVALEAPAQMRVATDDPSLLATRDPGRARARFEARGWLVYGTGRTHRRTAGARGRRR